MLTRIAMIGLGAAARTIHLPACRKLPNVEIVGGCDPLVAANDDAQRTFRFPVYSSPSELLERSRPDWVIVATPPSSHAELVEFALRAGCHVLCEKPCAESLAEVDRLIELAEKTGRHAIVNQEYRFMRIHRAAREAIGTADFGDLLFLQATQMFRTTAETETGWRGSSNRRTCSEFGIHVLDLCRCFFGQEPVALSAHMQSARNSAPDLLNLIALEFPGGRFAQIVLDRLTRGRHRYLDLRLVGTAGCVETEIGGRAAIGAGLRGGTRQPFVDWQFALGGSARLYQGERQRVIARDPLDLFAAATAELLQEALAAVDNGTTPPCTVRENRKSLRLVFAAYESAGENGKRIVFDGDR